MPSCAREAGYAWRTRTSSTSTRSPATGDVLRRYPRILVPEMNLGQLSRLVRAEYLVDARSVTKVRGLPFTAGELEQAIVDHLKDQA